MAVSEEKKGMLGFGKDCSSVGAFRDGGLLLLSREAGPLYYFQNSCDFPKEAGGKRKYKSEAIKSPDSKCRKLQRDGLRFMLMDAGKICCVIESSHFIGPKMMSEKRNAQCRGASLY